jgi:CHAT domain-containing protein
MIRGRSLIYIIAFVAFAFTPARALSSSVFESTAAGVWDQHDTTRLDSLVQVQRYASYRLTGELLERYFDTGNQTSAALANQLALAIQRVFGDPFFVAQSTRFGVWYQEKRDVRAALKARFEEATRSVSLGSRKSLTSTLDSLARQFLNLGDSVAAVKALQYSGSLLSMDVGHQSVAKQLSLSLLIARSIGDLDALARCFNLVGNAYQNSGYSLKAGNYFDSSRVIRTQLQDRRGVAECLGNISAVHYSLDQISESYRFATEALRLRRELGDTLQICQSLLNMVSAFRHHRPLEENKAWMTEVHSFCGTSSDTMMMSRILQADGMIAESDGEFERAEVLYDSALVLLGRAESARLRISLLTSLALLRSSKGDYDAALRYHLQATDLAAKTGNNAALASSLHNIGTIQRQLGDSETAIKYLHRSLEIRRALVVPNEMVESLCELGDIYLESNDLPAASEYYHQAEQIARSSDNPRLKTETWTGLARVKQRQGAYREAAITLDSALSISRQQSDQQASLDILIMRADFARIARDFTEAERQLTAAKAILESRNTYANLQRFEIVAGMLQHDRGEIDSAFQTLSRVVWRLEQSRRTIPSSELRADQKDSNRYLYEDLIAVILTQYQVSHAPALLDSLVRYFELAKSRSLEEALDRPSFSSNSPAAAGLQRQSTKTLARIERLEDELGDSLSGEARRQLQSEIARLEIQLVDLRLRQSLADPLSRYSAKTAEPSASSLIAFLSNRSAAALSYLLTPEKSLLIMATRDGITVDTLPGRQQLTRRFAEYSSILQRSAHDELLLDSLRMAATDLTNIVLGPVADRLAQYQRIYIVPDGALSLLPFESLIIEGRYLAESLQVIYTPSLQVLLQESNVKSSSAHSVLVIADPEPGDKVTALPYSRKEAEWIAEALPSAKCSIRVGSEAVRSALMSAEVSDYDIIHFATHSAVDYNDPSRSRIWLSPDTAAGSAQYLTLADIMQMSIPADLAVLSSCESGGGRFRLGEGITGFVQGFMSAGCHNVMVSLWDVEDYASAVFMKEFYRNIDGGYDEALHKAKLAMIQSPRLRLRHPYYWAAFVLTSGR